MNRFPFPRFPLAEALPMRRPSATKPPSMRTDSDSDQPGNVREIEIPRPGTGEISLFTLDQPGTGAIAFCEFRERMEPGRNNPDVPALTYYADLHVVVRIYAHIRSVRTLVDQGRIYQPIRGITRPAFFASEMLAATSTPADRYEVTVESIATPQGGTGMRGTMRIGARSSPSGTVLNTTNAGRATLNRLTQSPGLYFEITPPESPTWIHELSIFDRSGLLPPNTSIAITPNVTLGTLPYHLDILAPASATYQWQWPDPGLHCPRGARIVLGNVGDNTGIDASALDLEWFVRFR